MHNRKTIVINTSPIIALAAGVNDLNFLVSLYDKVIVPKEVFDELTANSFKSDGLHELLACSPLHINSEPTKISAGLKNSIDLGEAAVIQTALDNNLDTVCIDEVAGRRTARLHQLSLTGSLGICIKARKQEALKLSMVEIIKNMEAHGIFLSDGLIRKVIEADKH